MDERCAGRVAIVTGAGGGIGRHHALHLAMAGATVVVNDVGAALDGSTSGATPAQSVVDEIVAAGGLATANHDDVSDTAAADALIAATIEEHGRLDVLVNNAGIIRDKMLVNLDDDQWDDVIRVHLRGTFAPSRAAARYWRVRSKDGDPVDARIITTTSTSGLYGNAGQTNYAAAKAGIVGFTTTAAIELARYGVTVNAIAPGARTRMTEGLIDEVDGDIDPYDPAAISPLVTWLAGPDSRGVTGQIFGVHGGSLTVIEPFRPGPTREQARPHTVDELDVVLPGLLASAYVNPRLPAPQHHGS